MKFSYITQLVLQQIGRKKLSYLFLSILLTLISFLMIVVLTMIYINGSNFLTLNKFKNHDVFISTLSSQAIENLVSENDFFNVRHERISSLDIYENEDIDSEITAYVYGDIMTENMVLELKEGIQLKDADIKNGAYPIIVPEFSKYARYYDLNKSFELYYSDPRLVEDFITNESLKSISVYVCGLLKYPYHSYQLGNILPTTISDFYTPIGYSSDKFQDYIIMNDFYLDDDLIFSDTKKQGETFTIVSIDHIKNSAQYNNIYSVITEKATVLHIDDLIRLNRNAFMSDVGDLLVAYILVIILAILAFSGINIFLYQSLKNEYSLYFMCGAKWSMCIMLECIRNIFIIFIPTAFGALISYIFIMFSDDVSPYYFRLESVLYIMLFIVCIFAVSSLYFLIKLGKTKPIDNIRLMVKE